MTVIAMTREMGTLGKDVTAKVASELGLGTVHSELVERGVAERMNVEPSQVHRFLEGEASMWERWRIDKKRVARYSIEEILQVAQRGNVIIRGWGAAQLLADVPHVITLRICAPLPNRIAEMKARLKIDNEKHALSEIERSDESHDRAVRAMFRTDWRNPEGYAATLNTGFIPVDEAAVHVINLTRSPVFAETSASREILANKLILARVRSAISEATNGDSFGEGLKLSIEDGRLTIIGALRLGTNPQSILDAIGQIEGVTSIDDQIEWVDWTSATYFPA